MFSALVVLARIFTSSEMADCRAFEVNAVEDLVGGVVSSDNSNEDN